MLKTILFVIIGATFGFLLDVILSSVKDHEDVEGLQNDWIVYKCPINNRIGCSDNCCIHCDRKEECRYNPCNGNPKKCNQAIISLR